MCIASIGSVLLLTCNVFLGICGICLTIIGALVLTMPDLFHDVPAGLQLRVQFSLEISPDGLMDTSDIFKMSAVTMMTFGCAIFVVAVLGACSSLCGGICRFVYSILLCAFIAGLVVFIIYQGSSGAHEELKEKVACALRNKFKEYLKNKETVDGNGNITINDSEYGTAWFYYQTECSQKYCCGVDDYNDYSGVVPPSCCQLIRSSQIPTNIGNYSNYASCIRNQPDEYINIQGCAETVYSSLTMGPQIGIMLPAITIPFLVACLAVSTHLMG